MKKNTKISIISNATLDNQIIYNTNLKDITNFVKDNKLNYRPKTFQKIRL